MGGRSLAALVVVLVSSSCAGRPAALHPVPQDAWRSTLGFAQQSVVRNEYSQAESALAAFAVRYPNTPQATESQFWIALFTLDPRNDRHSPADAIRALAAYTSAAGPHRHEAEAEVLRRTAAALLALRQQTVEAASEADSARTEADSVRTQADSARLARVSRDRTREEVQRLRDSLDKVVAELSDTTHELDRIKKRLVAPKP